LADYVTVVQFGRALFIHFWHEVIFGYLHKAEKKLSHSNN